MQVSLSDCKPGSPSHRIPGAPASLGTMAASMQELGAHEVRLTSSRRH